MAESFSLVRTASGFAAADSETAEAMTKIKKGERLTLKRAKGRSSDQNRLYWALLKWPFRPAIKTLLGAAQIRRRSLAF
jgi:hypothetical protein